MEFLTAAETLIRAGSKATFMLVGTGKNVAELKQIASGMDLRGQVVFAGLRSDVESVLRISDVFVYPSVWEEAFGLANVEAMACGLPVISTHTGGIPEVVEENVTGWLVPPRDARALAEAMQNMAESPETMKRFGAAGRQRVLEKFDLTRQVEETFNIYKQTLEG
jgi:glycosyltransferase involved in cell wall biosynthesis